MLHRLVRYTRSKTLGIIASKTLVTSFLVLPPALLHDWQELSIFALSCSSAMIVLPWSQLTMDGMPWSHGHIKPFCASFRIWLGAAANVKSKDWDTAAMLFASHSQGDGGSPCAEGHHWTWTVGILSVHPIWWQSSYVIVKTKSSLWSPVLALKSELENTNPSVSKIFQLLMGWR